MGPLLPEPDISSAAAITAGRTASVLQTPGRIAPRKSHHPSLRVHNLHLGSIITDITAITTVSQDPFGGSGTGVPDEIEIHFDKEFPLNDARSEYINILRTKKRGKIFLRGGGGKALRPCLTLREKRHFSPGKCNSFLRVVYEVFLYLAAFNECISSMNCEEAALKYHSREDIFSLSLSFHLPLY